MGYPFTHLGSYGKIVDTSHVDNYLAIPSTSIFSIPAEICEIAPIAMRIWQISSLSSTLALGATCLQLLKLYRALCRNSSTTQGLEEVDGLKAFFF